MKKEEQLAPSLDPDSQVGAGSREPEILNENHRLQLRYTFQCIDSVLTEIEQILADPERKSPFSPYICDVTLTQRRIARDYISRIRARMTNLMREQVIPFARPRCGTRWAALTTLLGATISTEELTPDRMRGYGEVSGEGRKVLQSIRAELGLVIGNLRAYLEECATADLEERIWGIAEASPEGASIQQLDRIITTHSLVEHRNALSIITSKLEAETFEIAVFGRVSCGKSSLLNYLLEGPYLPVDVTRIHQQLAAAATRRKIVILHNAIIASLESRLACKSGSGRKPQPHRQMLLEEFREVGMLLESSLRGANEICREIEDQLDRILTETVGEVVTAWIEHADVVPSESLAARICQVLAKPIAGLERGYWQALERATRALAKAEEANPKGLSLDLPAALGMPGLDPTMVCASLNLTKPVLLIALTASMTKQQVHREAFRQVGYELRNFLNAYARQLRSWFREAINNLRSAFISAAGIHRTDLEPLDADLLSDRAQIAADLEQLKRASWNRPNDSTIAQFPAGR
jgi:GTPase SAR1 family protein